MTDVIRNYKKEIIGVILITAGFIMMVSCSLSYSPFLLVVSGIMMGVGLSLLTLNFIDFFQPNASIPQHARYALLKRDSTYELWVRIAENDFRRCYSHPNKEDVLTRMTRLVAAEQWLTEFNTGPIFEYELYDSDGIFIGTAQPEDW